MFVDEAEIYVKAGDGGDGCVSFRREKFVPFGGPDGGDGGDGGSVYIEADPQLDTLAEFVGHHHWRAENGRPGQGKNKTGRKGRDLIIKVPVGTLIYDKDKGILIKDLKEPGERVCVARGGKGGRGNKHFANAVDQAPRIAEKGQVGEERNLRLELKLIADVGLVGLPNAGKSTLLSRISRARPKIADYPFTTLHPVLGIVDLPGFRRFIVADLPGLIEGAHMGAGLGDEFLRHIERTRLLLHVVDINPIDGPNPKDAYNIVRNELASYSQELIKKPFLIAANKMDLSGSKEAFEEFLDSFPPDQREKIYPISAVTGYGIETLLEVLWQELSRIKKAEEESPERVLQSKTEDKGKAQATQ